LVRLEQVELLGEVERLVFRLTAPRSPLALDLVRALGAAPAFLGGEVMRGGSASEPPSFDTAQRGERVA